MCYTEVNGCAAKIKAMLDRSLLRARHRRVRLQKPTADCTGVQHESGRHMPLMHYDALNSDAWFCRLCAGDPETNPPTDVGAPAVAAVLAAAFAAWAVIS